VGTGELALSAISIAAILARSGAPGRLAGLGWTVYGVLHFGFHVTHLVGSAVDRAGNVVSLGIAAILGIVLLLPSRVPAEAVTAR
jgi:hypothetical protein